VQRVNGPGIGLWFVGTVAADGQRRVRREKPAHDLGVAVSAVVEHNEQAGQAFHHVSGVVEERPWHHDGAVTADPDEVAFAELLSHLGHWHAEQSGDGGQVIDRLTRI
jgi:hypothetical protein